MRAGTLGDHVNPWGVELFRTLQAVEPTTAAEQSAYDKWLEQTSTREEARRDRVHGAAGVIPTPLWIVLFFIATVIFVYMLFFADSGERALVQGVPMGAVVAVIATLLLLLATLGDPFHGDVGGLDTVAMERLLGTVDDALATIGAEVSSPATRTAARPAPDERVELTRTDRRRRPRTPPSPRRAAVLPGQRASAEVALWRP